MGARQILVRAHKRFLDWNLHIGTSSCHITPSEAQALHQEINQKNATSGMRSVFAELGNVKTDCTLLASLFSEVAKCLNQDVGSGRQECRGRAVARFVWWQDRTVK